ncbi:MAG: outer membrane beta-barrel protein [Thermodesulfovibrionales bacterium]|nr:outer membrane beta-barrel protein [Thermodesulfovibrionales bacterium]
MGRSIVRLLIAIAVVTGLATTSFAGSGLLGSLAGTNGFKVGPVSLHAGLQVSQEMNSNIYSSAEEEIDDYITVFSPAVLLSMKTQRHNLNLGVSSDTSQYADNDDENFTSVTYKAGYGLKSTAGLEFDISDTYETSMDPRPEQDTPERKEHFTNNVKSSIGYTFPAKKFYTEFFVTEFHLEYDEEDDSDGNRKDSGYGVGLYYRVLPKTSMLLEYSYGTKEYFDRTDEEYDSRSNFYRIGIKWDATARMNGSLKIGYEDRTYSAIDHDNGKASAVDGDISYKITEQTKLKVILNLAIMETSYMGSGTENLSQSYFYDQQKFGIGMSSRLMNRFTFDATVAISNDEYENYEGGSFEARKDITHNIDASAGYDFNKNFTAGLKYSGKNKESNDPDLEEVTHEMSVYVRYVI